MPSPQFVEMRVNQARQVSVPDLVFGHAPPPSTPESRTAAFTRCLTVRAGLIPSDGLASLTLRNREQREQRITEILFVFFVVFAPFVKYWGFSKAPIEMLVTFLSFSMEDCSC